MIHYTVLSRGARRFLLCAVMLAGALMLATSCGDDDEPKELTINYYMDVEERFLINGTSDLINRYFSPVDMMEEAIRNVYPKPDIQGNDEAVIAACDEKYQEFYSMYSGREDHLTCTMHLMRARMEGKIVKHSEMLKTYVIDVNPVTPEE